MKNIIHIYFIIVLFSISSNIYSKENKVYINEYHKLYQDLINYNTYGYIANNNSSSNEDSILTTNLVYNFLNGEFHLAIIGSGYFKFIDDKGGHYYSRNGILKINSDGQIVNKYNDYLFPKISIKIEKIDILSIEIIKKNQLKIKYSSGKNREIKSYIYNLHVYKYIENNYDFIESLDNVRFYFDEKKIVEVNQNIAIGALIQSKTDLLYVSTLMIELLYEMEKNKVDFPQIKFKIDLLNKLQIYMINNPKNEPSLTNDRKYPYKTEFKKFMDMVMIKLKPPKVL